MKTKIFQNKKIHYINDNLIEVIIRHLNSASNTDIIVPQAYNCFNNKDHRFATSLFEKFPSIQANLEIIRSNPEQCFGKTQFIDIFNQKNKNYGKVVFANMLCQKQTRSKRSLDYIMLGKCMHSVGVYLNEKYNKSGSENITIYSPKFGIGSAGGNWSFIEELITDCWSNWNVLVYSNR